AASTAREADLPAALVEAVPPRGRSAGRAGVHGASLVEQDQAGAAFVIDLPPPPEHLYRLRTLSPIVSLETLYRLAALVPSDEAIVELGTFRGASAVWMAAGARAGLGAHVWTIDPHDLPGHRTTTGRSPGTIRYEDPAIRQDAERQIAESGFGDGVTMIRGFSVEEAGRWTGPKVGLLFIDGDHREHAARKDFRSW